MSRYVALLICVAATAKLRSQDMPLHEILRSGESWVKADRGILPPETKIGYRPGAEGKSISLLKAESNGPMIIGGLPIDPVSCVTVAIGGSHLLIGSPADRYLWAAPIQKDGSLGPADRYCRMRVAKGETRSEVSALTVDASNRIYAATIEGIQIFDPTGRLCGVITVPNRSKIKSMTYGGPDRDWLIVDTGTEVFRRKMLARGRE